MSGDCAFRRRPAPARCPDYETLIGDDCIHLDEEFGDKACVFFGKDCAKCEGCPHGL